MSDPVKIVISLIKSNDVAACAKLSEGLRALMNRRNQNIFWHALIDRATRLHEEGTINDPLAMAKLFVANRLDPNAPLDSGELPLSVLMSRSPGLGLAAAEGLAGISLNEVDRSGRTVSLNALDLLKTHPGAGYQVLAGLVRRPSFDLSARDQGASVCFKGLSWAPIAAATGANSDEAIDGALTLIAALDSKGYDFNAARETPDSKFGSTINTPLAYCVKKAAQWLEWSGHGARSSRAGTAVWAIANDLIRRGADPCLQMEAGQRVQLMDLCRKSNFPSGMMQSLESGLLAQSLSAEEAPKVKARRL